MYKMQAIKYSKSTKYCDKIYIKNYKLKHDRLL